MYTKEEIVNIKKQFWIEFAKQYPRKWLLYNTKIKDFSFKFFENGRCVQVALEIEHKDIQKRTIYYEKVESLKEIILQDFFPDAIFDRNYINATNKEISRIWVELSDVTILDKKSWPQIFDFFSDNMTKFEMFFYEYRDYIVDLEVNT